MNFTFFAGLPRVFRKPYRLSEAWKDAKLRWGKMFALGARTWHVNALTSGITIASPPSDHRMAFRYFSSLRRFLNFEIKELERSSILALLVGQMYSFPNLGLGFCDVKISAPGIEMMRT